MYNKDKKVTHLIQANIFGPSTCISQPNACVGIYLIALAAVVVQLLMELCGYFMAVAYVSVPDSDVKTKLW